LSIRIIDDFYIKDEKNVEDLPFNKLQRSKAGSIRPNELPVINHESKLKLLRCKSKIYKHEIIERIIKKITPTIFTLKSIFMTTIYTPSEALSYIKGRDLEFSDISFYSKDALIIYIKLLDRIAVSGNLELLEYACNLFLNLLYNILDTTRDKIFTDVFESNKICLKFFYIYLYTFRHDKDAVIRIKNEIIQVIHSTIHEHDNPFYFNLIFALYSSNFQNKLILEFIETIAKIITTDSYKTLLKYSMVNCKNFLILIYRIIFVKTGNELLSNDSFYQLILDFLTYISQTQLIYSKLNFNTFFTKKLYTAEENKQRTILELIFEICIEIFRTTKKDEFIKFLNSLFIVNNVHTIFYYIDTFYFHPSYKDEILNEKFKSHVLDAVDSGKVFKEGRNNNKLLTFYFLIKSFVYTYYYEKENNTITLDYEFLEKLEFILTSDIQNLDIISQYNINKTEVKGI
jgi:hypothetical protein